MVPGQVEASLPVPRSPYPETSDTATGGCDSVLYFWLQGPVNVHARVRSVVQRNAAFCQVLLCFGTETMCMDVLLQQRCSRWH